MNFILKDFDLVIHSTICFSVRYVHDFPSHEVLCIELEEKISLNNNNHLFVIVIIPYL